MFLRFATIGAEDSVAIMYNEMAPTLAFIIIAALVNGGTLFFYKKKTLQMRLSNISGITNIILQGYLLYHLFKLRELCESASYAHEAVSFSLTMVFPAIAAILDFLASRAISRQEAAGHPSRISPTGISSYTLSMIRFLSPAPSESACTRIEGTNVSMVEHRTVIMQRKLSRIFLCFVFSPVLCAVAFRIKPLPFL